ncbi:MAG: SDR family oxidoreductase [Bacteroidales bacterium]|nr:SDR family oxidoreductase [Bacteroidales bacterium]
MSNLFDLDGKVAVMTGATGVLGKSIVKYLAKQGCKMVLLSREKSFESAKALVEEIISEGGQAINLISDVLDKESLENNLKDILKTYGKIDILLNAAGGNMDGANVPPHKTIFDMDLDAMRKVVDLNIFGTVTPTMVFAKAMVENGGTIINFCSESTFRPLTRVAGYGIAKAGVGSWTKWLAAELAIKFGEKIRVNGIAPGFILTNQNRTLLTNPDGSLTDRSQKIIGHTPIGRFVEADELLGTIHYLCSDASKAVTGTISVVDGGFESFTI